MRKSKMCLVNKGKAKRVMAFATAAVLLAGSTLTASAETYTGASGWLAEFNSAGTDIECNFEKSEVTDEMAKLEPGDTMTVSVQIKNSYSDETDWYMENTVIQSLEDQKDSATGGGYEYVLSYNGPDGAETLYDSSTLGGDSADDGEGLHEADGALEDYFYLDRLANGETGTVTLAVTIDGETQGNGYQNTLAQLQMIFAVEKVSDASSGGSSHRTKTVTETIYQTITGTSNATAVSSVKTGDTSNVILYSALALAAGLGILFIVFWSTRRRDDRGEGE